jgi:hypothetical protein
VRFGRQSAYIFVREGRLVAEISIKHPPQRPLSRTEIVAIGRSAAARLAT